MEIMSFFKRLNKRMSITKKMVILYVILILMSTSFLYFYYSKTTRVMETEVTNSILQALNQAEINISYRLDNVRDISNSIFMNAKLYEFLSDENKNVSQQILDAKELGNIISSAQTNTDVSRVRLFVDNKKNYSGERINFFPMNEIKERNWYTDVMKKNGMIYWVSTYKESYIDSDSTYVISCARILKNPRDYDMQIGVLVIDLPEINVYKILSGINTSYGNNLFILDKYGKVISHNDKSKIGGSILKDYDFKKLQEEREGVISIGKGENKTFIIHKTMNTTGWNIVAAIPAKAISERNSAFSKSSNAVSIVIILIAFMLVFFLIFALIAEGMNRRIKNVINIMKKEGVQSLDDNLNIKDGDFNLLEKSVDGMLQTMHNLMEESYQSKMNEREAELKALQAQINPHFLYNTLDTINWMAIRINAEDISGMVDSLAKYFRLSLNKGRDIVSVLDEINLARVYLEIQKMRFVDSIDVEFEVEKEVEDYRMPKLILQPIIENAVLHGIQKKKERKGTIKIVAKKSAEKIFLIVTDNGIGMDEEQVRKLLSDPKEALPLNQSSGYGLYNVNERIRLFSGEGYEIQIESEKGKGTIVKVSLKCVVADNRTL